MLERPSFELRWEKSLEALADDDASASLALTDDVVFTAVQRHTDETLARVPGALLVTTTRAIARLA